ncbi:MAG: N5-glutamine methyltransferase family protein [bacterium]
MSDRAWTILELLKESTAFLEKRGIESPRVNAEVLLGHTLGVRRVDLYARFDAPVGEAPLSAFRELVRRRLARVPLQYLTGSVEFYSRAFAIREGVFIPRPETELLVERALDAVGGAPPRVQFGVREAAGPVEGNGSDGVGDATRASETAKPAVAPAPAPLAPLRFAEIGVGSGAILASLLLARPQATAVGTDLSDAALTLAAENARAHGVDDRVEFRAGSLFEPFAASDEASFDLVLANPPYLSDDVLPALAPEVRDHEPRAALTAADGGLAALRALVAGAWTWLRPRGVLALEIGDTQGAQVGELLAASARYDDITLTQDYAAKDRVYLARRKDDR